MAKSVLKTVRASDAVSTAGAKDHLNVTGTEHDVLIGNIIKSAQQTVEDYTGRKLSSETWYLYLDEFPKGDIVLPYSPVTSVTSVKYYDANNSEQTYVANTDYYLDLNGEPARIRDVSGWDGTYDKPNAVTVEYVTGYTRTNIPEPLRSAMRLLIADMYDNRMDKPSERFTTWKALCYPYRIWRKVYDNEP